MQNGVAFADAYLCLLKRAEKPLISPILKLGGSPVLYQEIEWPKCSACGQELEFLAQLPLDTPIPFSHRYSMAYVFMCPGKYDATELLTCPTYLPNSGANRVFLQAKSDRAIACSHTPDFPDYHLSLQIAKEPIVDTSDDQLPEEILENVHGTTKLGGVPSWIQDNETPKCPSCGEPMKFVAQLDAELDGPLQTLQDIRDLSSGKQKLFNFGDAGLGYVFICEKDCSAEGSFLWQTI